MTSYDFRSLSPIDFESLVRDLMNADLGLKLASFAVGRDGGIDLEDQEAQVIVQCKHRPDAKKPAMVKLAEEEALRPSARKAQGYYFVTSATLSPDAVAAITNALTPLRVPPSGVWHRGKLNGALAENSSVEKSHFKLWLNNTEVISKILHQAEWQRSEALIRRVAERVKYYVYTPAYDDVMEILANEYVVMITGAPGVGKSTLAEMALLDLWNEDWTVHNVNSDIDEAWAQFRKDEDRVVFYYDDFLGQTDVAELQKNESGSITDFIEAVRRRKGKQLLILTSREQVLNQAKTGVDDRAARLAEEQTAYRLQISDFSRLDRAKMLFNYVHFAFADKGARKQLASDRRFLEAIDHPGFNPRVLESVTLQNKSGTVAHFYSSLFDAMDHPERLWRGSFMQLSTLAVSILYQLALSPDGSLSIERLRDAVRPADSRKWTQGLKVLESTWITISVDTSGDTHAALYDPSRRDFLLDQLEERVAFDFAFNELSGIDQLSYLYRLADMDAAPKSRVRKTFRTAIKDRLVARAHEIDKRARSLSRRSCKAVEPGGIIMSSVGTQAASRHSNLIEGIRQEHILKSLTDLSSICFGELAMPKSEKYLEQQLPVLKDNLTHLWSISSSLLFRLAEILSQDYCPQWAHELAMEFADLAFEASAGVDDLRNYADVSIGLRDGVYSERGGANLRDALDRELDGVKQQDDADMMSQWLDDIEDVASQHDIDIDTDSLRQEILEMEPSPDVEPVRRPQRFTASPYAQVSDEDVAILLRKLNIE